MNLFDLFASLRLNADDFYKGIQRAQQSANTFTNSLVSGFSKTFTSTGNSLTAIGKGIYSFGDSIESAGQKASVVTGALGALLTATFGKAKSFIGTYESAMVVFRKKLQGGEEEAKNMYNELVRIAKGSAYAQEHMVEAGKTLVAMGLDFNKTTKYVQVATDAIAGFGGTGADVEELAHRFARMSQQTNLYTMDLNMLVDKGVPAWDILATKYKKTTAEIKDMARKGLLPAKEGLEVLTDAMSETNEQSEMFKYSVAGMAQALKSGTLTGVLDSLNTSFRSLSLSLLDLDPREKTGIENISKLNNVLTAFGQTMEKIGVKFSKVGQDLGNLFDRIAGVLNEFNASLDAMPKEKADAIVTFIEGIAIAGPGMIVAGKAIKTYGKSVQGLGSIYTGIGKTFGSMGQFIQPFTNVMGSVFSKIKENSAGLTSVFMGLGNTLSSSFPSFVSLFQSEFGAVGDAIGKFGPMVGRSLSGISSAIFKAFNITSVIGVVVAGLGLLQQNFGDKIAEISNFLVNQAPAMIQNFVNGILGKLPDIMASGVTLINTLLDVITTNLPLIIDCGIQIMLSLITGVVQSLPQILAKMGELITDIVNVIITNLPAIIQAGIQILSALIIGLAQQLPTLIPAALDMIITIVEALLDNIDQLIDAGIELIIGLAEGLINALPKLIEKGPVIIEKLINAIASNLPKIAAMAIRIIVELAVGLVRAIPQLVSKIPQIINALVNGFNTELSSIVNVGKDLVRGLWNGINDMVGWIASKIRGFGEGVLGALKSFFHIGSPSKLMRDEVGRYIAQGIGVGFSEEMGKVEKSMVSDVDGLAKKLQMEDISYNQSVSGKANAGMVNGLLSALGLDGNETTINLVVDGRTLAEVMYNPMSRLIQQKGAVLNA